METNTKQLANDLDATIIVARDLAKLGRSLEATTMIGDVGSLLAAAMGAPGQWDISMSIALLVDSKLEAATKRATERETSERIAYNIRTLVSEGHTVEVATAKAERWG